MPVPWPVIVVCMGITCDFVKRLCQCLCNRDFDYVKDIRDQIDKLETDRDTLLTREEEIKDDLERNKTEKEKKPSCDDWLKRLEKVKNDIKKLRTKYDKTSKSCCGVCSVLDLVKLDKKMVFIREEVSKLKSESQQTMIRDKPPPRYIKRHPEKMEGFTSQENHVTMLQNLLLTEESKTICLWGPVGAGKTTIMEHVHNAVGELDHFNIIFWISVEGHQNIIDHIQDEILKRLRKQNAGDTNDIRANKISELLKEKRYVLFLDQVHSEIDLRRIGIHIHDYHSRGKVVFACTDKRTCGKTDEVINVKGLSDEDALKLFWKIVGECRNDNGGYFAGLARQFTCECGGMPQLIRSIGKRLTDENDPEAWETLLRKLKCPSREAKQVGEEIYRILKLICEELENKHCFLYLAIFPAGYELHRDYITECWRAEGYLQNSTTFRRARQDGHDMLDNLFNQSLLDVVKKRQYKMFRQYRSAASRLVKDYGRNSCIHDEETNGTIEWQHVTRISQIRNQELSLPQLPPCPQLETMLLQRSGLTRFPPEFFAHMSALRLLDLHRTQISSLPSSITGLKKLKALYLNNCKQLMALPPKLQNLSELEILDMRSTGIHLLPQLTVLKCLKVSFPENKRNHNGSDQYSTLQIGNLRSLEELSIDVNNTNQEWDRIASEVGALKELATLCCYFPTVKDLQSFYSRISAERTFPTVEGIHVCTFETENLLRVFGERGFSVRISEILKQACSLEPAQPQNEITIGSTEVNVQDDVSQILLDCMQIIQKDLEDIKLKNNDDMQIIQKRLEDIEKKNNAIYEALKAEFPAHFDSPAATPSPPCESVDKGKRPILDDSPDLIASSNDDDDDYAPPSPKMTNGAQTSSAPAAPIDPSSSKGKSHLKRWS